MDYHNVCADWYDHDQPDHRIDVPIPVCRRARAKRSTKVAGVPYDGTCSPKNERCFVWKLHLVCDSSGIKIRFMVRPARWIIRLPSMIWRVLYRLLPCCAVIAVPSVNYFGIISMYGITITMVACVWQKGSDERRRNDAGAFLWADWFINAPKMYQHGRHSAIGKRIPMCLDVGKVVSVWQHLPNATYACMLQFF